MPPEQVILFIVGTIVILFGAYYVTYYIGMKASGQTRTGMKNRNINLLDRYAIARDKQFCIIEIADKVYVVGITNHTMTLLDTLDAAAFAELTESKEEKTTPWGMTPVGQYGNKLTRKVVEFIAEKTGKKQQYENNAGTPADKRTDAPKGTPDFTESMKEAERTANEANSENPEGKEKPDDSKIPDLPNMPDLPELPAEKLTESTEGD
ncbi:MAG: flagellar biosynthetic protein FliO [Oscillospiraceae bacterium]|nr:flagellar biosynthetic protein FliO [Oscillospiraceae bacterium]